MWFVHHIMRFFIVVVAFLEIQMKWQISFFLSDFVHASFMKLRIVDNKSYRFNYGKWFQTLWNLNEYNSFRRYKRKKHEESHLHKLTAFKSSTIEAWNRLRFHQKCFDIWKSSITKTWQLLACTYQIQSWRWKWISRISIIYRREHTDRA